MVGPRSRRAPSTPGLRRAGSVASVVGFLAVLFTGSRPAGLGHVVVEVVGWVVRVQAPVLLGDEYPPFRRD